MSTLIFIELPAERNSGPLDTFLESDFCLINKHPVNNFSVYTLLLSDVSPNLIASFGRFCWI